ncbi:hypothetical protein [Natronomonas sp. LN261]|uniref:hypothetical protein n=1 Tax=Natronomonas sp. LN261 TaxID=2750669 RepID=UPI0015EFB1DD|nr:hypothetical protein [Natronomonas sp. LN261]
MGLGDDEYEVNENGYEEGVHKLNFTDIATDDITFNTVGIGSDPDGENSARRDVGVGNGGNGQDDSDGDDDDNGDDDDDNDDNDDDD